MHVWNRCYEKVGAASQIKVSSYILVLLFLCNVQNLPVRLQLSWQSGFCHRQDVFTSFCEIKCKGSGMTGTNEQVHSDIKNSIRVRLDLTT